MIFERRRQISNLSLSDNIPNINATEIFQQQKNEFGGSPITDRFRCWSFPRLPCVAVKLVQAMVVLLCCANAPWKNSSVAISPADCVQIAVQHQIFAKEQVLVSQLLYQISVNIFGMSVFEMKVEHKISIYWFGDEPDQPATVPHVLCVHSLGQVICLDIAHNPPPHPPIHSTPLIPEGGWWTGGGGCGDGGVFVM